MTAEIKSFLKHAQRRGEQPIAQLYRVEAALIQAGFHLDITHGSTDEGDPWVVFCRPENGAVIAHVAVIGGEMVADSPAFTGPVRMRNVSELIARLVNRLRAGSFHRGDFLSDQFVLLAGIVALATLHLTDAGADWRPLAPETFADLGDHIAAVPAEMIARAALSVEHAIHTAFVAPDDTIQVAELLQESSGTSLPVETPDTRPHPHAAEFKLPGDMPQSAAALELQAVAKAHEAQATGELAFAFPAPTLSNDPEFGSAPAWKPKEAGLNTLDPREMLAYIVSHHETAVSMTGGNVTLYAEGLKSEDYHLQFADGSSLSIVGVSVLPVEHGAPM